MLMKKMQTDRSLASHGPMEPLQPQWPLPCLPREGKEEQQALEPAQIPGPVTSTVGCIVQLDIRRTAKGTRAPELFRCF